MKAIVVRNRNGVSILNFERLKFFFLNIQTSLQVIPRGPAERVGLTRNEIWKRGERKKKGRKLNDEMIKVKRCGCLI